MKKGPFAVLACAMILGLVIFAYVGLCSTLSVSELPEMPWGAWQNVEDEPRFTFTIDPEDETYQYPGTYELDGETTEIFLEFTGRDYGFNIFPLDAINEETGSVQGDRYLFSCSYRVKDDVMTCWVYPKGEDTRFELTFVKIAELEERKPL